MARAVYTLTKCQTMHRRINPNSVVFGSDGKLKIGDLGAVKVADNILATQTYSTVQHENMQFIAPEFIAESQQKYKYKVDVFATGLCMLYMITATYAYQDGIDFWDYEKHENKQWESKVDNFSNKDRIKYMINGCLTKQPEARLSSEDLFKEPMLQTYIKQLDK